MVFVNGEHFVSCKDYDDDIDNINKELSTLKGDLSALQAKVNEGKWITSFGSKLLVVLP